MTAEPITARAGNYGAGDRLTPGQHERLARAVAVLLAKREAYRSGASAAQVEAQTWLVQVDPLDPRRA